jgi:hypothetical protein
VSVAAELDLMVLPDDVFRSYVDEAVRGHPEDTQTQELRSKLKDPEVVDRTYLTLVSMKKSVEGQLAARRADFVKERGTLRSNPPGQRAAEERYHAWRAGALRFKSGVEDFMLAVRGNREKPTGDNYYLAYQTLRQAIEKHREAVETALANDQDTDDADAVLWSVLDDGPT